LLKRQSSRPKYRTVSFTAAFTSASWLTSACRYLARTPSLPRLAPDRFVRMAGTPWRPPYDTASAEVRVAKRRSMSAAPRPPRCTISRRRPRHNLLAAMSRISRT
jgi:hypothetical protein